MSTPAAAGRRRRVALTFSPGRLEALPDLLVASGFEPVSCPLIETVPRSDAETGEGLATLSELPWLLLTSRATVQALHTLGFDLTASGSGTPRLGAVGPATTAALEALDATVSVTGVPADAEGLARAFLAHPAARGPVGLPRGSRALATLDSLLGEAGLVTRPLVVYDTRTLTWSGGRPAAVVLASPSAVAALPEEVARGGLLVTLGSTTGEAVRARGWQCEEAVQPTAEAALAAVERVLT